METMTSLAAIVAGLLLRLAIPIAVTVLLIVLLRILDARWQADAQSLPPIIQKPECWKIKGCTPEQHKDCAAAAAPLPCWQVYRLPNGYLREQCLSCKVFTGAPMPSLKIKPRRM